MDVLKNLFGSKKFVGFLIGVVLEIVVATKLVDLDPAVRDQFMQWIGVLTGGYTVGQGIADHGKEAAKITTNKPA